MLKLTAFKKFKDSAFANLACLIQNENLLRSKRSNLLLSPVRVMTEEQISNCKTN